MDCAAAVCSCDALVAGSARGALAAIVQRKEPHLSIVLSRKATRRRLHLLRRGRRSYTKGTQTRPQLHRHS
jgi:hypothetical protein